MMTEISRSITVNGGTIQSRNEEKAMFRATIKLKKNFLL